MAETVKLFVNGQEVEVESGKNLIDALGAVGIDIPHLCYHPALGADGNCRMCLVGIEDGRPPVVPACKTQVAEGMKVLLDADHIKKIQRDIMELELINHPIDCPICDQAGECSLQDYYMKYDGQSSRMREVKVPKDKKIDFGCGVVHDQERCIACARCVRFTRNITKTGELGLVNRTDLTRVNIFPGRPLNNRYALNVVDLCPVGAMTSSDFRFKQRVWFLAKDKSVCHGCSKGCSIYVDHNKEKYKDDIIYRYRPRPNEFVNGYFMCDAGRMTYKQENNDRITKGRVNGKKTTSTLAVDALKQAISQSGKKVFLLSPESSLEELIAVKKLAEQTGAALSGYSEGYIVTDDGDDFLIQDDKSANRAGLELLGLDTGKQFLETALKDAELLVCFANKLPDITNNEGLKELIGDCTLAVVSAYTSPVAEYAEIVVPAASFTESEGSIINCDNILQHFAKAVKKNEPFADLVTIAGQLGGEIHTNALAWIELNKSVDVLKDVKCDLIPEQGLALNS
ncbi:MAG: NADH-quinone oxidoreductase subunit G [Desulfobulbus propionicus]|nr:MAG: NADH-quinone oxidoreductase subunit G [Desulfobulbus propionicus]